MGAEDSRHFAPEAGDEEQVQPHETGRKDDTSRPAIPYETREYRSRDVGVFPSDTGQPRGLYVGATAQSSREVTRSGGTGQIPGTGIPWETVPGQVTGIGRPWETIPGREVTGGSGVPGQVPGTGRPWETVPGRLPEREVTGSGVPGQVTGILRPWETVPGRLPERQVTGSGVPGQVTGVLRPWETVPGRLPEREVTGSGVPGQVTGIGRPWETVPGRLPEREVTGSGVPGQVTGIGRPWETVPGRLPGREFTGSGEPGQVPGTGRPWEPVPRRLPGREFTGSGVPGQVPGTGRPWKTMPGPGTSGVATAQASVARPKRETHRERLLRERKTIDRQIEDAKTRLIKKMVSVEKEVKALGSVSPVKKKEIERKMVMVREHYSQGVQKVNEYRDATFGRLLKKIEDIEGSRAASSRMDWEELDDLIVNMMMVNSQPLQELEDLQKNVDAVKRTLRSTPMQTAQSSEMPAAMRAPSSFHPAVELEAAFSSMTARPNETVITIDEKGGLFNVSDFGVFLHVPPNAVGRQTKIMCKLRSKDFLPSPAGVMETLVSHIVELGAQNLSLQQPIVATLLHSGPGRGYGYETVVKAFNQEQLVWEELEEYKSGATTQGAIDYIRVRITKLTVLAVISRLITDRFEVTPRGCLVRSSVCEGVMLQFPEGAVTRNVCGSLQVLMMPKRITTTGYPCPILFVHGFEGINFGNYVLVRIPHPCPSRYPVGEINLMCLKQNQWSNITTQTDHVSVEQQYYIDLHVQHFSGFWAWLLNVPSNLIELFGYLCQSPQAVCFAAFKEFRQPSLLPKITLLCVANHDEERMKKMKGDGYGRLARTTASKKMRPSDNAFMKVDGKYQAHWKYREFFLQFLRDEPCIKELRIEERQEMSQADVDNAILSFYSDKEFLQDDLICILDVKENTQAEHDRIEMIREIAAIEGHLALPQQLYNPHDSDEEQDNPLTTIVSSFGAEERLLTISAQEVAQKLPIFLGVNRVDQQDPPPHVMKQCRIFCRTLKALGREDIVTALRDVLPAGMTGPLSDGSTLVRDMNFDRKTILTRHLSVTEKWKPLAQELGADAIDVQFFEARTKNHSMAILETYGAHLTVNQLYKLLVRIGANAIADHL